MMDHLEEYRRLLLISNSTLHERGYLDHAEGEIRALMGTKTRIVFIPYALHDRRAYARKPKSAYATWVSVLLRFTTFPTCHEQSKKQKRFSSVAEIRFVC